MPAATLAAGLARGGGQDERVLAITEVRDRSSNDICFSFVAAEAEVYVFDYVALGAGVTFDNDGYGRSTNRCASCLVLILFQCPGPQRRFTLHSQPRLHKPTKSDLADLLADAKCVKLFHDTSTAMLPSYFNIISTTWRRVIDVQLVLELLHGASCLNLRSTPNALSQSTPSINHLIN